MPSKILIVGYIRVGTYYHTCYSEKLNISKMLASPGIIGKSVKDVNFRGRFGVNIIAIEKGDVVIQSVIPDYEFEKGDILYISGDKEGLAKVYDIQ